MVRLILYTQLDLQSQARKGIRPRVATGRLDRQIICSPRELLAFNPWCRVVRAGAPPYAALLEPQQ